MPTNCLAAELQLSENVPQTRVLVEPVQQLIKGKRSPLSAQEKSALLCLVCNAFWPMARRRDAGYKTDGTCEHCGELDTIKHRWTCAGFKSKEDGFKKLLPRM